MWSPPPRGKGTVRPRTFPPRGHPWAEHTIPASLVYRESSAARSKKNAGLSPVIARWPSDMWCGPCRYSHAHLLTALGRGDGQRGAVKGPRQPRRETCRGDAATKMQ